MRVFSHTCSNTEIVCALGAGSCLVGVDADSDYPPEIVAALPKPGRDLDLDVRVVAELAPDLVLTSLTVPGHERIVAELQALGLRTITIDPLSLEDVYASIATIASALGIEQRGADLIAQMRKQMPAVEAGAQRPRISVEWWPKPVIVPARQSWVTDIIELAGGCNPWADLEAKSVTVDHADHARQADAVVMSWCGVQLEKYRADVVLRREEAWHWPALVHGRVHPVTEAFLGRPGPRLVHGYAELRKIVSTFREERK